MVQAVSRPVPAADIPEDVRSRTLFDWVPTHKLFVAPYGRPFSQRKVDGLRQNFDLNAVGVILLSFRADDTYAILDGQHRKIAAEQEGHSLLPARIYIDLSYEDEAQLYVRFATVNKQTALDRFRARIEMKEPKAMMIAEIVRDFGGLEISSDSQGRPGFMNAVTTVESIYDEYGPTVLQETCTILRAAWAAEQRAWCQSIVRGVAMFVRRYRQHEHLRYDRLTSELQIVTPSTLLARANMINAADRRMAVAGAVGIAVQRIYNEGLRTNRLPDWETYYLSPEKKAEATARFTSNEAIRAQWQPEKTRVALIAANKALAAKRAAAKNV